MLSASVRHTSVSSRLTGDGHILTPCVVVCASLALCYKLSLCLPSSLSIPNPISGDVLGLRSSGGRHPQRRGCAGSWSLLDSHRTGTAGATMNTAVLSFGCLFFTIAILHCVFGVGVVVLTSVMCRRLWRRPVSASVLTASISKPCPLPLSLSLCLSHRSHHAR
jgi:hypothetical protein